MLQSEELRTASVLVFANKQDVAGALPVAEVTQRMGLTSGAMMCHRRWHVQVSFQWKNPGFLFKTPDFLLRIPNVLLKNIDFLKQYKKQPSSAVTGEGVFEG